MIALRFEKLYKDARMGEPCSVAIPLKQGALFDAASVCVLQDGEERLTQCKVTSRYGDGSIRWLFVRFLADLPGNAGTTLYCDLHHWKDGENTGAVYAERGIRIPSGEEAEKGKAENAGNGLRKGIGCEWKGNLVLVDCGALRFSVKDGSRHIIESLWDGRQAYGAEQWEGPYLKDGAGRCYGLELEDWRLTEVGPVCAVVKAKGWCVAEAADEGRYGCEVKLTAYYGKPWIEVSYALTNTSMEPLKLESLAFALKLGSGKTADAGALRFTTTGTGELEDIEAQIPLAEVRTCVATSNYRTRFEIAGGGQKLSKVINEQYVYAEGCEHFAEVYYGTFFADRTDEQGGVCAAVFQAYQNYPKALEADDEGLRVLLVPEGESKVVMEPGMAREQRFQLHFHGPEETLAEVDNRAIIYQMPDRPVISPEVYEAAGVMPDIFVEAARMDMDTEAVLIAKCDAHARCFGMLNWGDAPDPGYTAQGRGHGAPVWTNNEYDFTHACTLLYARTGLRRFLDYALVSGSHWKDVDVCHYSTNPLHLGGHWEHTHGHVKEGSMVCSHEWVEGLLDCWHFTGDENYRDTAVGIAENVLRLLETPMYQKSGEFSARETGWALRTLVALYVETGEKRWVEKADWIVHQFQEWNERFGHWLAPYMDNVVIRVPFMISVAVGSLMRYYQIFPREDVKEMMLDAIDDVVEYCLFDNGFFSYKELPSLNRLGNNPLVLELLTIGYRLSGDRRYLEYGRKTYAFNLRCDFDYVVFDKRVYEDAVITGKNGTKTFAQSFLPMAVYYKALTEQETEV